MLRKSLVAKVCGQRSHSLVSTGELSARGSRGAEQTVSLRELSPEAQNGIFLVAKNVAGQLPPALLKPASKSQWRSWLAGRAWKPVSPTLLYPLWVFFLLPSCSQAGCLPGTRTCRGRGRQPFSFWRR